MTALLAHLRVALRGADTAPPRPHLSVHLVLDVSGSMQGAPIARCREAAADAEPAWHDLSGLRPAEDPRDRAQSRDARCGVRASRGSRAEVHRAELLDGRGEREVPREPRVADEGAVARLRCLGQIGRAHV